MIEGSSIDEDTIKNIIELKSGHNNILVCLDPNHTHDHVKKRVEFVFRICIFR